MYKTSPSLVDLHQRGSVLYQYWDIAGTEYVGVWPSFALIVQIEHLVLSRLNKRIESPPPSCSVCVLFHSCLKIQLDCATDYCTCY